MTRKSRPFWNRLTQAMKAQAVKTDTPQRLQPASAVRPLALEQRFMFDGAAAVDVAHAATDAAAAGGAEHAVDTASALRHALTAEAHRAAEGSPGAPQRQEVVFVDGQVSNIGELLQGLSANAEVVILDPNKDGLQQMADYLQGRSGLDAIHLLSHGADGTVQLGNVWLASTNLAEHRAALESIGVALNADGDLMIYGCDVGQGDKGQAFIDQLAAITGADVAASADDTGAVALGGNWTLERSSGAIETAALSVSGYDSLLVQNYTGGSNPNAPLLGSGASLTRSVVGDFNNDGRADILYQGAGTGAAWNLALGNANGSFTVVTQGSSPFANVTLLDAATNGVNYHAADFDGDGDIDLLVAAVSGSQVLLYRNNGSSFTTEDITGGNAPAFGVRSIAGDFNADGSVDLLYQTDSAPGALWRVKLNNGNGTFVDVLSTDTLSPFKNVNLTDYQLYNYKVADVDGDGDSDLMYAFQNTQIQYLRNDNGVFTTVSGNLNLPVTPVNRVVLGDFDGDGDADVLYQTGGNGTAWRYARNDGSTFTDMDIASSPFSGVSLADMTNQQYRVGDFDGDGDLDIFVSSTTASSVYFQGGSSPKLASATPADDSLNVLPTANIVLTFDQAVSKGTGNIYIVRTSDNTVVQTIAVGSSAVTGSGTTWTIDPPADLAQGVAYAIRIDNKTFANADGKVYAGIKNNVALNFTTSSVQPPVIANLNGDAVTYVEDSAYVLLDASSNATVSDADSSNFNGGKLTAQITTGRVNGEDVLFIRNQGAGANQIAISGTSVMYNGLVVGSFTGGSNGDPLVITFSVNANATTVAALVQNLAYRNSNTVEPSTASRSVSISMDDGTGGNSTVSVVTLDVLGVNDTPLATVVATNPTYTENTSAVQLFSGASINTLETGQRIVQMTFTVSTVYNGAAEKLVIDGSDVTLTNGTSVVTTNNGTVVTVSVTSGTASVTLTSSSGLDSATAQTILNTMAYRNDSESPNVSNRVVTLSSVTDNGGSANGGLPTATIGIFSTVAVVGVNDAPVLSGAPYSLPSTNEDTTSAGVRVSTLLTNYTMVDADTGALRGIAVITKSGNGIWQYSTDNANWTDFGAVSGTSALLLSATTYIRYVPDGANGETASLTFRAWDQTTGSASVNGIRGTADTTSNGGTTAFSTATAVTNQVVTSVNDAPVMTPVNPTLSPLTDTSTSNSGNLVSTLLGGVTDVDTGALKGMSITAVTATYGKWQFTTDNGSTWLDVGTVSTTQALNLRSTDRVRFVPDGIHGETATITYKAWDRATGGQGVKVDTTVSGGTSAFSTATDTASVVVTAVNDAPVVTVSSGTASWTEGNNVASTPVVVDPGLTLTDADGPNPLSASARLLTYYSAQDTLSFVNDGLTMGNIIGTWTVGTGTLTLTSAGNQATVAQFEAALRAITYNNSSNSPNTTSRTIQFTVTDGSNSMSTAVTRDVSITAVNDSPTISAVASLPITEDTPTALGQITFSDVDTTLGVATFSVGSGTLSAIGAGGVTVGGTATALTLSGTLANINNFIAANRLLYTPAANASGDVTLTININTTSVSDATTTVTLQVAAVNDAPVISAPASITVTEDVSSVISGFSFTDVDAGINTVTATFSVPSGTLSAVTGMGVTVSGSDTGELTLSGSLADINFFVAANGVTFKTAQDATASVTLTVTLNDKGFSGSGGEKTDTKTVTLNVNAVNDAPVNNVPGAQTASQNIALGFNTANGNAISITDVDAGNGLMTVTLTATNGTLSLSSLSGLTMLLGTGTNDGSMIFEGNRTNINAALQTLSFKSGSTFLGAASLTIETNDNGNSGSGGAKTDVDTISINVIPVNPKVTNVSAQGLDRSVKIGDEVLISMTWDQVVNVDLSNGSPTLLLETGLVDRDAVYVSGSGSNTLVFKYTVQAGDVSADLDFQSTAALQMNGAVISNNSSDLAVLTLPTVGGADSLGGRSNIVVDGVVPVVASVQAPTDGTYIIGQNLDFTVNFSENMVVSTVGGTPRIAVTLDTGGTVYANYVSGSGGSALVFRLTVASGQLDSNGISLGNLQLNGGTLRDTAGNDTVVTLNAVASTTNVNIDGVVPTVTSVAPPIDGNYKAGDVLTFTVNASEALQTGGLPPRLVLDVGGVTRYATYISGSGSAALVFQYIVQAGDNDANGIAVNSLDLRGEQLTDLAGNDLDLTLNGVGSTAGVVVDTVAPSVGNIVRVDVNPNNSGSVSYTVTFSENVSGVDANDFNLVFGGTASGSISSVTAVDGHTYTVVVGGLTGTGNLRLDLNNSGTGIVDAAGNAIGGGLTGATYSIDRVAPSIAHVSVPAKGTYVAGQNLDFTVTLDEAVLLNTSNGSPRLEVTLDNGQTAYATYLSGAGSTALVFRLTVAEGQLDTNGIVISSTIQLNGATLRDSIGNDANLVLNNVGDTSGIKVDAVVPVVNTVVLPANGSYKAGDVLSFIVNASEGLLVNGSPRLALDVGGATRYATLIPGGNGSTLVFQYTVQAGDNDANGISVGASLDLNGSTVRDAAGNDLDLTLNGLGATSGVIVDTLRPTATIVVSDTALAVGETSMVTITFSEAVSGLDIADFSVEHGVLSHLKSSDGGHTWTATLTPTAGITDTSNVITLNNAGYVDAAGNSGEGTTDSNHYAVDTQRPTATIVVADTALAVGETTTVTITFSKAVSGLDIADFSVEYGVLSHLMSSDGGLTWTATLTPAAGITDASNVITLNNTGYVDAAGNTGAGATDSNHYAIDTQRPTATIVVSDNALKVGEASLVTISFSEAVTGLDLSEFTVEHGVLSHLTSGDGGLTWTAILTPTAGITHASNLITLNNSAYVDAAGNSGMGTTVSNVYAIDTLDPVAPEITLDQATLVNGRQVSRTGLVIISGLEAGGSWQYSLDNGASWIEGRGNEVQLPALGAFNLWVLQRDAAGNPSAVTALSGIVEPSVPPVVPPTSMPPMNDALTGSGLAPFQPSVVAEPNADFLRPASTVLGASSPSGGIHGSESWSGYGIPQSVAGVNDWMDMSVFAPAEPMRSGFDPVAEQFSVSTGASILDLKPVLLASDSPWDIASLQFSFSARQELPAWVRLDRHTGQLTINAPKDLSTTLVLQIKVSDGKGHESVRTVKLVVGDARATSAVPAGRAGLSEKMAHAAHQQAGKRMSMYVHG